MSEFFVGEIRAFSGDYAPNNWLPCDGRKLQIRSNTALYALLGTVYGGDGVNDFALPDLRGAFVLGAGVDPVTGTIHKQGETTARATTALTDIQMPAHIHTATFAPTPGTLSFSVAAYDKYGSKGTPQDNLLSQSGVSGTAPVSTYTTASDGSSLNGVNATGGSFGGGMVVLGQAGGGKFSIMPPFVAITYMIAVSGIYPPRS